LVSKRSIWLFSACHTPCWPVYSFCTLVAPPAIQPRCCNYRQSSKSIYNGLYYVRRRSSRSFKVPVVGGCHGRFKTNTPYLIVPKPGVILESNTR
jgi:hypothetical protein